MMAQTPHQATTLLPLHHQRCDELGGFHVGDEVWLADMTWPHDHPRHWRAARVLAVLPRQHQLVLRATTPDTVVDLNPILHPHLIRRTRP